MARYLLNKGSGENILMQTATGYDAGSTATITLASAQYVYAVYANDLLTGKMVEQIIDNTTDTINFTHYNPFNNVVVVGG
jgi:hypothetical protein